MQPSTNPTVRIDASDHLADLATRHAGASRVFHRYGLDFCCHGAISLKDACAKKGLDLEQVLRELRAEVDRDGDRDPAPSGWQDEPLPELIDFIVAQYHNGHRQEIVRLVEMAQRVEAVHGDKASCPNGLAALVATMREELEQHMQKEEQILFPMLRAGRGADANAPIRVMEAEHEDHAANLERVRALTKDFVPPEEACGTWRALYLGLADFEMELMRHVHLENHVLFPRALRGA